MTLEEFTALTPEEQAAILTDRDNLTAQVGELTAERDSFKNENGTLTERVNSMTAEMAKVKEMNYTLTRQLDLNKAGAAQDAETILHDMFMMEEKK